MSAFFNGADTTAPAARMLVNVGFWPDIDVDHLKASLRLGDTVSPQRIEVATVSAMQSVNQELASFRADQEAVGHARAALIPGETIAGETLLIHRYRRAVYSGVGAELAERYRGSDTTSTGSSHAEALSTTVDEYRRDMRWAISDILGIGRSTVELI